MKPSIRTQPASKPVLVPRLSLFRTALIIVWIITLGGGLLVSQAQSTLAQSEKTTEPAVQPINFRQPDALDFDDHAGYVRIFDGTSLKDWDGDPTL
jgi:hypothetical protein